MKKVCLVSSQGGHLAEARLIADGIRKNYEVFFVTDGAKKVGFDDRVYLVEHFVRNPLLVFKTAWQILKVLRNERPQAIVCTGAEIGLPAFFVGKLLMRLPFIYVECSAQVFNPSGTGRILYRFVDLFLVQWEPLLKYYGKRAKYRGGFI